MRIGPGHVRVYLSSNSYSIKDTPKFAICKVFMVSLQERRGQF